MIVGNVNIQMEALWYDGCPNVVTTLSFPSWDSYYPKYLEVCISLFQDYFGYVTIVFYISINILPMPCHMPSWDPCLYRVFVVKSQIIGLIAKHFFGDES
jgi:hypothetical protein